MADDTSTPAPSGSTKFEKFKAACTWVLTKIGAAPWWVVPVAVVAFIVFHI